MNGTILIEGLEIECIIGIHPQEREKKQRIIINLSMVADVAGACQNDEIASTVDYESVANLITKISEEGRFKLLERLAYACGTEVLRSDPLIQELSIEVRKPDAIPSVSAVGISLSLQRSSGIS